MTTDELAAQAHRAIAEALVLGEQEAALTAREMELEYLRSVRKIDAIRRIMDSGPNPASGKPHSFSSAEAIVETDAEYAAHLGVQRDVAQKRIIMRARAWAARQGAALATALVSREGVPA